MPILLSMNQSYAAKPQSVTMNTSTIKAINNICYELDVYSFHVCATSLKSDPRTFTVNLNFLPNLTMDISYNNTGAILIDMQNILQNEKNIKPIGTEFLLLCTMRLDVALDNIQLAFQIIGKKDSSIITYLYLALREVTKCGEYLKKHGMHSTLERRITTSAQLIQNALDFMVFFGM
ncbi:hypothetical protein FRX31_031796 [Thalictrum thalictroides]|uniref:Pectinesterase inhibitor domain-containing protein n=1 Tax=Thalictrum thalictroides TaxID=46969 RepID=A0A7J6V0Y4_THATH|nr:hypothetical protein FRX31_031796 [Thalictrum thalictroides]